MSAPGDNSRSQRDVQVLLHHVTCSPAPVHFGVNCVWSKMRLPFNQYLCSRLIIDNPQHIEGALFGRMAHTKVFFIYALS